MDSGRRGRELQDEAAEGGKKVADSPEAIHTMFLFRSVEGRKTHPWGGSLFLVCTAYSSEVSDGRSALGAKSLAGRFISFPLLSAASRDVGVCVCVCVCAAWRLLGWCVWLEVIL